jgi:hypothetical protein
MLMRKHVGSVVATFAMCAWGRIGANAGICTCQCRCEEAEGHWIMLLGFESMAEV